jgi:hypothetical protein
MIGGDRFRRSREHLDDVKTIIDFVCQTSAKELIDQQ